MFLRPLVDGNARYDNDLRALRACRDQATIYHDYYFLPVFSSVDYIAEYRQQNQPDNTARRWIDAVAGMLQLRQARPQPRRNGNRNADGIF
jgi:hypothetical protein